jgi:hypothetical protein
MGSVKRSTGRGRPLSPLALKKSITRLREAATRGKDVPQVNEGYSNGVCEPIKPPPR